MNFGHQVPERRLDPALWGGPPANGGHRESRGGAAPGSSGLFLGGRIPLVWLQQAGRLPGRALHVAVVIRFLSCLEKSPTVKLRPKLLREFGVQKDALSRSLDALSEAGLIEIIDRTRGRGSTVRILEAHK